MAMLVVSVCLVGAAVLAMEVQSALRAYVAGQGMWSKGQKDAVYQLMRLAQSRDLARYRDFRAALDITLGDRQARLELEQPDFDPAVARAGFLRGGNDAADIAGMIRLYRYGRHISYMERAVDVWVRGDAGIEELAALGAALNVEVGLAAPDESRIGAMLTRAYALNDRLNTLGNEFAATLGEASRAIHLLLMELMLALSAALFAGAALAVRMLLMRNQRLQADLEAREARYRSLFENSVDAVLLANSRGSIHEANQAACRLFGHSEAELCEIGRDGLILPDTPGLKEALEERERTGYYKAELELMRKDGSRFVADVSSAVVEDGPGERRVYLIIRDISERRAAQASLERVSRFNTAFRRVSQAIARSREPAELYRQVCESAVRDGGIRMAGVLLKQDGGGPLAVAASGGAPTDYFDKVIISPDPASPFGRGPASRVVNSGEGYVSNAFTSDNIGEPWREALLRAGFAAVSVFPLREQGRVTGIFVCYAGEEDFFDQPLIDLMDQLAREVSFALDYLREQKARAAAEESLRGMNQELERRVAERTADLRATNRALEESNQELGSFSYSVSHDLRGPLRAINGFAALLVSEHAQALDGEARDYLHRLREASLRMDRLTTGLLDLAQLGRVRLSRGPLDLSAMARAMAEELLAGGPPREVEWIIADGLSAEADAALARVMLGHLLGNAYKFTRDQAHPRIEFGAVQQASELVYFIADNGCGFDMAYAKRIFGAFARLHAGAEYEGLGIGLATARRIIERHGGRIWARAEPGQGATFYFTLAPAPEAGARADGEAGEETSSGRSP